jgi:hypothetical protein
MSIRCPYHQFWCRTPCPRHLHSLSSSRLTTSFSFGNCDSAVLNVTIQAQSPTGSEVGVQGNVVIAFDDECSRFRNGSIYILSFNSQSTGKGTFFLPYILMTTVGSYTQATLYLVETNTQPKGSP